MRRRGGARFILLHIRMQLKGDLIFSTIKCVWKPPFSEFQTNLGPLVFNQTCHEVLQYTIKGLLLKERFGHSLIAHCLCVTRI